MFILPPVNYNIDTHIPYHWVGENPTVPFSMTEEKTTNEVGPKISPGESIFYSSETPLATYVANKSIFDREHSLEYPIVSIHNKNGRFIGCGSIVVFEQNVSLLSVPHVLHSAGIDSEEWDSIIINIPNIGFIKINTNFTTLNPLPTDRIDLGIALVDLQNTPILERLISRAGMLSNKQREDGAILFFVNPETGQKLYIDPIDPNQLIDTSTPLFLVTGNTNKIKKGFSGLPIFDENGEVFALISSIFAPLDSRESTIFSARVINAE